jgi:hypothetical protein
MFVYRSSQLRGKCTCPPGSACDNNISCDFSHVVTEAYRLLVELAIESVMSWTLADIARATVIPETEEAHF